MRDPGAVLDVFGPSQEGASLHDVLAGMVKPPFFPVHMADFRGELRFHDLEGSADFALGSIQVKARAIPHIGHTLGYRLEADGRSVVYISDHQAPVDRRTVDKEVLDLTDGADLIIHDAQYTDEEFMTLSDWGHSTAAVCSSGGSPVRSTAAQSVPSRPIPYRQGDRQDAQPRPAAGVQADTRGECRFGGGIGGPGEGMTMTFDLAQFKDAMSRFTTGVTIVAGMEDGQPVGFTCQSFVSLSIEPPFVAVAPARTSTSWPRIARAGASASTCSAITKRSCAGALPCLEATSSSGWTGIRRR